MNRDGTTDGFDVDSEDHEDAFRAVFDEVAGRRPKMLPLAGSPRGFEVRGVRATPPVPTEPTVTEMLEGRRTVKLVIEVDWSRRGYLKALADLAGFWDMEYTATGLTPEDVVTHERSVA